MQQARDDKLIVFNPPIHEMASIVNAIYCCYYMVFMTLSKPGFSFILIAAYLFSKMIS